MNDRSKREETIFHAAVELPPAKRFAYLALACEGDERLRERVEMLLRSGAEADPFFQKEPLAVAIGVAPSDASPDGAAEAGTPKKDIRAQSEQPGSVIGRYKIREKIGEGGCGVVYVAEQEEPVRRRVALKVIKVGMDTKSVIARFDAERQALAMMDHPNIAKVLDAGATETGRPYFVMELVRGIKITDYCDQNKLTTEQRLELFIKVCQAVQHAHQKAIIHRDLKPSNILVTINDGVAVPKIIDFGIAKATEGRLTDLTLYTELHQLIGTPAYMSPEQALMTSVDIDTRSDIYSLGVLLYELLVGRTPFDPKELTQAGVDEMRRTIREKEPLRPSTRLSTLARADLDTAAKARSTEAPRLRSSLRGDLDWIVMKCLEKDRARRYETANGLAMDIRRYLNNEPVVARPPSTVYRMEKAIRRNKLAFTAGVAVLLALLAGVGASSWQAVRAEKARKQANQRLSAALAFVDQVFNNVAPGIQNLAGATSARETLGQAGLKFVQNLRTGAGDDPTLRVAVARLLLQVSEAQNPGIANTVGDYAAGLQRAEEAIELLSTESPALGSAERLNLLLLAKWARVYCLNGLGRWDEVVTGSEELEPLLDQLERLPDFSRSVRTHRMTIRNNVGATLVLAGRPKEAIDRYIKPFLNSDYARSITNNSSEDELRNLLCAYDYLTSAYAFLNQFDAMLPAAKEALRVCEVLVQRFPFECQVRGRQALLLVATRMGNDAHGAYQRRSSGTEESPGRRRESGEQRCG